MILVITDSFDVSTNQVIDWLNFFESPFKRLNNQSFIWGKYSFRYDLKREKLYIDNIEVQEFTAIWYRRWISFNKFNYGLENFVNFPVSQFSNIKYNLVKEHLTLSRLLFSKINRDSFFLPKVSSLRINKLDVLKIAESLNINIPSTIITNNKNDLIKFHKKHKEIISKPISEIINYQSKEELFIMRTGLIDESTISNLDNCFSLSLFQEYIEKEIELRIFFLDGKFYPMAIFSQGNEKTKYDFRNYDEVKPNRTVPYNLPSKIKLSLIKLMNLLDLNTGSIDMIKTKSNKYYFLEVNPVGQFGMVSHPCNYNLEYLIANKLSNEA